MRSNKADGKSTHFQHTLKPGHIAELASVTHSYSLDEEMPQVYCVQFTCIYDFLTPINVATTSQFWRCNRRSKNTVKGEHVNG